MKRADTTEAVKVAEQTPQRIGPNLYRRGDTIFARVTVDGKRTFRSTGTNDPATARAVLAEWRKQQVLREHGIEPKVAALERQRLTVGEVIDAYVEAGCPTRKMRLKSSRTVDGELQFLKPIRVFFGQKHAATLTLADADAYRDWRNGGGYKSVFRHYGHETTRRTNGGDRAVDLELTALGNALSLAVRRTKLKVNPLAGRGRYTTSHDVRHCREVAPTPEGLQQIEQWLRTHGENGVADCLCLLAYSGLRIGEGLALGWDCVDWAQGLLHVVREKRGVNPWVPILPELDALLRDMQKRVVGHLLFPSRFDATKPEDDGIIRRRLTAACESLGIGHVTPHGLRSYFVTQARQSGLTDAEIAMLIGDKTGPSLISEVYGDVRPDHLIAQAKRIQLRTSGQHQGRGVSVG
ncbi:MAG TPA: tyrosine-type recombinase/integrase [Verrucomicrobiae bacterium]|nr:tyrosine-type recombinase/integrase [Verrucomicrobiae bacterium]